MPNERPQPQPRQVLGKDTMVSLGFVLALGAALWNVASGVSERLFALELRVEKLVESSNETNGRLDSMQGAYISRSELDLWAKLLESMNQDQGLRVPPPQD